MPPKRKASSQPLRFSSRTRTPTKKLSEQSELATQENDTKRTKSLSLSLQRSTRNKNPVKSADNCSKKPSDEKTVDTKSKPTTSKKTIKYSPESNSNVKASGNSKDSLKTIDIQKLKEVVNQAFISRDTPKLSFILEELKTTHSETLFKILQSKTEDLQKKSQETINYLTALNEELKSENRALKEQIAALSSTSHTIHSSFTSVQNTPTLGSGLRRKSEILSEKDQEDDYNEMNIDMTEQITGHRIISSQETDHDIVFRCFQVGSAGEWKYTLTVDKSGDSDDMLYIPGFQDGEWKVEEARLNDVLPEYFFEEMKFPMGSLKQFYSKLNKCINKIGR